MSTRRKLRVNFAQQASELSRICVAKRLAQRFATHSYRKIPFMLVLGDREMEQKAVAVRERAQGDIGVMSLASLKRWRAS